jgi:hypothetical protein
MGGEDDGPRRRLIERIDGRHTETLHLVHHPLVVDHLPEDLPIPATRLGKLLHLLIGNAYTGAKAVFLRTFDFHQFLVGDSSSPLNRGEKCTPPSSKQGESGLFCRFQLPIHRQDRGRSTAGIEVALHATRMNVDHM